MKQASVKLYIRFGEIPEDGQSKVHFSDQVIRSEGGLSVWKAIEANGRYYPMLPEDANEAAISDYFHMLECIRPVYLVTGQEIRLEGADREPLLQDVVVLKDITWQFQGDVPDTKVYEEAISQTMTQVPSYTVMTRQCFNEECRVRQGDQADHFCTAVLCPHFVPRHMEVTVTDRSIAQQQNRIAEETTT